MAHQELSDTRPTSQHVTVTLAEVPPAAHVGYDLLKRALDVVGSATLLILLAPVLLVIIVLVKMTSPGPVFFRQERAGLRNVPFRITKFRSMYADAEARIPELRERARNGEFRVIDAPAFKAVDDPRVTKVGKFLRKSSLDELPQLFDVLVGNMSLVGPRPLVLAEAELLPVGTDPTVGASGHHWPVADRRPQPPLVSRAHRSRC